MDFSELKDKVDSFIASGVPEAQIIVMQNHKELFRYAAGYTDEEKTEKANFSSLRWMFSMTKPITAVAVMRLAEQGKLKLDDQVEKYLPTFRDLKVKTPDGGSLPAENELTVARLLSMQGGYDYNRASFPHMLEASKNPKATTMEVISALGYDPVKFEPGTSYCYSLCLDVAAALIEAASGKTYGQFLKDEIFDPLGMKDSGFHPTKEQFARFSQKVRYNAETGAFDRTDKRQNPYIFTENYESGGAGLFSNAADYIKFADAVSSKGVSADGYRLLTEQSINEIRRNRLDAHSMEVYRRVTKNREHFGYGLGVQTLIENEGLHTPLYEFGWDGAAGSYVSMDSQNGVSIVYTECCLSHSAIYSDGHPNFRELTYKALGF